jgi:hypothetical protein
VEEEEETKARDDGDVESCWEDEEDDELYGETPRVSPPPSPTPMPPPRYEDEWEDEWIDEEQDIIAHSPDLLHSLFHSTSTLALFNQLL